MANKQKKELLISILQISTTAFLLNGCNSSVGNTNINVSKLSPALQSQKLNVSGDNKMNIHWTVDNRGEETSLNSALQDSAWHLLTLTVKSITPNLQPTKVEGILSGIYPRPSPNVGQKVETQDINCQTAVFAKLNDSCSIYFRLTYDTAKGGNKNVLFPVQFSPKGDIEALMSFTASVKPNISLANYRFAIPAESKYYSAPSVMANKMRHQILVVKNVSALPIAITTLVEPTNPLFKVIHRTTNDATDPYYGAYAECRLSTNAALKQVSTLDKFEDSCIVVYQAANTSSVARATDQLEIATNASFFFPIWANKFELYADYTNANPEQNQTIYANQVKLTNGRAHLSGSAMVMDSNGSLEYTAATRSAVNAVTIKNSIRPAMAHGGQFVINQAGGTLHYNPFEGGTPLPMHTPLMVLGSNGSIAQTSVIAGGEVTPDNQTHHASIGGNCPINASVKVEKWPLYFENKFLANVYYKADGIDGSYNENIFLNRQEEIVYRTKKSNTWTHYLHGSYSGCKSFLPIEVFGDNNRKRYCVAFSISWRFHNLGEAQPRRCDQTLQFRLPEIDFRNYQTLANPVAQIAYIANTGQSYQGGIGNTLMSYTPSYQVTGVPSNGNLISSYRLVAAPASQVKFKVNLNAGDIFYTTNLDFVRSEGYDLTQFGENTIYEKKRQ